MAAPITHIVLAEKIFDKFFEDKTKKDFFIGTSFPDIRYLRVIDKEKTHYSDLILRDVKNDSSFLAGLKFHSILDIATINFFVKNDIYSLCPESKYIVESLKILGDELFYRHIKNWNEYIGYLSEVLPDELDFGIDKKDIQRWHSLLRRYFQEQPNRQIVTNFMFDVGFTNEIANEINKNISIMRGNKKIIEILENFYRDFDQIFQ